MSRHFLMSAILLFSLIAPVSAHDVIPLIEGSLVQAKGDSKIYYIQHGQKHWITTEQAFIGQGFRWQDIAIIDPERLSHYLDGTEISAGGHLGFSPDQTVLPDLAPVAPYDIRIAVEDGKTRLRFTSTFWNRGKAAFELDAKEGTEPGDTQFSATQKLLRTDGTFVHRPVGTLFWHEIHQHYHYNEFGTYVLELVRPTAATTVIPPVFTTKTTFCMRDDEKIGAPAEGPKQARKYTGCSNNFQGVSVGWADVYPSTLPDQYFDITGLPAGLYRMIFNVDPHGYFAEIRRDNNVSMTYVDIDPAKRTVKVVATASPYETPSNRFPDGSLIKAEGDAQVYVVYRNKKRLIRNDNVFRSYGFSEASIYTLPKRSVDVITPETLVRVTGTSAVYAVNNAGFKRRILNPEILKSYGATGSNVTQINQVEFDSMPFTNLIAKIGDDRVYALSSGKLVGTFQTLRALELDPDSVHGVNNLDFQGYAVSKVAEGLDVPWDIVFLPDGDMLVTERSGKVKRIGKQTATISIPSVDELGEGGLMGIALHPDFVQNKFVYLYYTKSGAESNNRIERFRLEENKLVADKLIVSGIPAAKFHDGGQLAFGPDGMLYATVGDADESDNAQSLTTLAGKTLRFTPDGGIPSDNPFGTAVWTYGHRNSQGIAWDSAGRQWQTEHGRSGATSGYDELNLIEKGKNYGWPTIQGSETHVGMEQAKRHSTAEVTWAPSGLAYTDGSLFFAGLKGASLYQAAINADGVITSFTSHFAGQYGRLRAVVLGPDGDLYITTSNRDGRGTPLTGDDKILRIHPGFLK